MDDLLSKSKEIYEESIAKIKDECGTCPYATIACVSGGTDSSATLKAAKTLGIDIDYILHVKTGTGIPATTEYVKALADQNDIPYLEADAGDSYERYVLRKGFFGKGAQAHQFSYHVLKHEHLEKSLSANIRKRKRNRPIVLLNGVRSNESDRRRYLHAAHPVRRDRKKGPPNYWVNLIHHWEKSDCKNFLAEEKLINPVSRELCRSGECNCGTMQSKQDREEASYFFPEWGKWLDSLEAEVKKTFDWGWGESMPKPHERYQLNLFGDDYQPLCQGCTEKSASSKSP